MEPGAGKKQVHCFQRSVTTYYPWPPPTLNEVSGEEDPSDIEINSLSNQVSWIRDIVCFI